MLLALIPTSSAAFSVRLDPGLVTAREVAVPQHEVEELARVLPPDTTPWTVHVQVPVSWTQAPPAATSPSEQLQAEQIEGLLDALRAAGLPSAQTAPLQIAQVVGLMQNGSFEHEVALARGPELLQPWQLLLDPESADTLSAALVSLALVDALGLEAELVRYPCPTTTAGVAFGLRSGGTPPPDTVLVGLPGGGVLYTLHPNAHLAPNAAASELASWSLAQAKAPGFDPGGASEARPLPPPEPTTPAPKPPRAPAAVPQQGNAAWWLGSVGLGSVLFGMGALVLRNRSRGAQVLAKRKRDRAREEF